MERIYYFFKNPIYKIYCFIFRPIALGVKVVVENNGKLLLVRISYAHKKWSLPGGGVDKGESFEQAALRELKEEVGIVVEHIIDIGEYRSDRNFKRNIVRCFYAHTDSSFFKIDNLEISEAGWFAVGEFPEACSPAIPQILEIYKKFIN